MSKITLLDLSSAIASSIISAVNSNNTALRAALDNTLSRDGTTPNQMQATLDMNSNRIINLVAAVDNTEPVRLAEFSVLNSTVSGLLATINAAVAAASLSASQALTYANNANTLWTLFQNTFYGVLSADPALDPNGNSPTNGDLYFNSVTLRFRVYNSGTWYTGVAATLNDADYGDVVVTGSGTIWTIDTNVVTNTKLAQMAANTIKGNNTGGFANALDLNVAQLNAMINSTVAPVFTNITSKPTTLAGYGITDAQPLDSDLTALAANVTAGLWASTAVGSGSARTLSAPAAGFTITNPAGTSGNPTFVLANDLLGLEGLAANGVAVRTATDTWTVRTLAGTANEITATNGDGVAGAPTFSLPTALTFTGKTVTGGTFAGGSHTGLTSLGIRSTGTGAFDLTIANTENLTAGRTLTIAMGDAARVLTFVGDATVGRTITGTAAEITVTNGDGVAGAPTISIPTLLTLTGKTVTGLASASGGIAIKGSGSGQVTLQAQSAASGTLTLPNGADTVVGRATTDTLTNKTLTTPVLNGTPTGTGVASAATASVLALRDANANLLANNFIPNFATTATAAGTTTLVVGSPAVQVFTGVTTQTLTMPVASTLVAGQEWLIINQSSGAVAVNSSGANLVQSVAGGNTLLITCVLASGTTAASWGTTYVASGGGTGTVTGPGSSTDRAIATWNSTGGTALRDNSLVLIDSTEQLKPAANSTTVAPIILTGGTVNTTAQAGGVEYDGLVPYFCGKASQRGYLQNVQYCALSSPYTLTSQTAAQKLFNASTNGAVTLPIGTYQFRCIFSLTSMAVSSSTYGFALGGAATFTQGWLALADKGVLATASAPFMTFNTAANTALTTTNSNTTAETLVEGVIRVTVAGTVIPQVSLSTAAAAIVGANSFFEVWAVDASGSATVQGNWS